MGLITLAQAKSDVDIPDANTAEDARVTQIIAAASDYCDSATNRKLASASYTHYFDGNESSYLLLKEFPITTLTSVHVDDTWAFGAGALVPSADLRIHRDVLVARRCGVFHYKSSLAVKVIYIAGYLTIPEDLQQACREMFKFLYYGRNDRRMGLAAKTKLNESVSYIDTVPAIVTALLEPYRRTVYVPAQLDGFAYGKSAG